MFWRRDFVDWNSSPKLLGMQQIGAEPVDFYGQAAPWRRNASWDELR